MFFSFLKSLVRQLVMVLSILLILVAVYVSVGRQFMPAIAGYKEQVEARLTAQFGVPVSIDSLAGSFNEFNPAIEIQSLRFNVLQEGVGEDNADDQQGLVFESARIELDAVQTLLQRQIVLASFEVGGLDLTARYSDTGNWMLSGISLSGTGSLDLDTAYDTIQRVEMLELRDVSITLRLPNGGSARFEDVSGIIQNSADAHFIHIDASMDDSEEQIVASVEVNGNSLDEISGTVHVRFPDYDYTPLALNERLGNVTLGEIVGAGQAWIAIQDGQFASATLQSNLPRLGFAIGEADRLEFADVSGSLHLERDMNSGVMEFSANDLTLNWNSRTWPPADSHVRIDPGRSLSLQAEAIDVTAIREIVLASGLAGQPLIEPLEAYVPAGIMRNLTLQVPLEEAGGAFSLAGNLEDIAVDRVEGTPAMSGISGFISLDYDFERMILEGVAEVDSEDFTINIADLFAETWQYDYVNGRVRFLVDTSERYQVKVSSDMIVAESAIVDGRAQFSANIVRAADGSRTSDLSLLVGALRVDGSMKSPYLPDAPGINPGLFRTMNWLDEALLDGAVHNSGIIFQGSLLRAEQRDTRSSFLAFFNFEQGQVQYIETWPQLSDVSGTVVVDNGQTNIEVDSGRTMGLNIGPTSAAIDLESDGGSWLNIAGTADGATRDGLNFLEEAPLEDVLGDLMTDWVAVGNVAADLNLRIPLQSGTEDQPIVEIHARLTDNVLVLPRYQLEFEEVTGLIDFSTQEGLHDSELNAKFFGGMATIRPATRVNESGTFVTVVSVDGQAQNQVLADWPGQTAFVRDLLGRTTGNLDYRAELTVTEAVTRLQINSDLNGLSLDLPEPYGKRAEQARPLNLNITTSGQATSIEGVYGSDLSLRVRVEGEGLDGIVYLGTMPGVADPWQSASESPGLEIRGNLDVFNVGDWLAVLTSASTVESPTQGLTNWLTSVSLDVGALDLYGQRLESVGVEILYLEDTDYWTVALDSQSIAGSILLPFDRDEYIEAYLAYLRLPGSGESAEEELPESDPAASLQPVERVDALAGLDPRRFPRVRFFAGEVTIGEASYGLGQFTMNPGPDGAEFTDLIVDFRGFQLGRTTEDEPRFVWAFDGQDHHSYLSGVITADDMANVLQANGFAASLESSDARFETRLDWPGSPAFFTAANLNGAIGLDIREGRFLQDSGGPGALKLISIINLNAIMRRLRFSDDLIRRGLAYDDITGDLNLDNGVVAINDRLVISGPSSIFQVTGQVDLAAQTIDGHMYITLPVSDNIPWIGLLTGSLPLAIGAYLFDQIFGAQVNNLTSAQYRLEGPWDGLEPEFEQAFGTPPQRGDNSTGAGQN